MSSLLRYIRSRYSESSQKAVAEQCSGGICGIFNKKEAFNVMNWAGQAFSPLDLFKIARDQ